MALSIHVDGGSRGNPGPAGAGVVIRSEDGRKVHEGAYFLGEQTNNAAEYLGLIRALQRAQRCGDEQLLIHSDSELMVRQITGAYRVKSPSLARLHEQAQMLLLKVRHWSFRHVPREENSRADELANLAMDKRRDVVVFDIEQARDPDEGPPDAGRSAPPEQTAQRGPAEVGPPRAGAAVAQDDAAYPVDLSRRHVRVSQAKPPAAGQCPLGGCPAALVIGASLPSELCIFAAHAFLPTVLAIQNTQPQEFAAIPTMTIRCTKPECGATFHVAPQHAGNGHSGGVQSGSN